MNLMFPMICRLSSCVKLTRLVSLTQLACTDPEVTKRILTQQRGI